MYGGIARITAKAGKLPELLAFLEWDAVECRKEAGTMRFDVWADPSTPDSVILYEGYIDADAFKTHQEAAPFKKFVAEIVPNLVEGVAFIVPFGNSTTSNADADGPSR
jgi:quinol monooxygenase YgiN